MHIFRRLGLGGGWQEGSSLILFECNVVSWTARAQIFMAKILFCQKENTPFWHWKWKVRTLRTLDHVKSGVWRAFSREKNNVLFTNSPFLLRRRVSEQRKMSRFEIQLMSFSLTDFFEQFPEVYCKINLIFYCVFAFRFFFIDWILSGYLEYKCGNTVLFCSDFDLRMAVVKCLCMHWPPQSRDWTSFAFRRKSVLIWIEFLA